MFLIKMKQSKHLLTRTITEQKKHILLTMHY